MDAFVASIVDIWEALPLVAHGALIALAGWILALFVRWALAGLLALLGFDRFGERTGLNKFLKTGNIPYMPSRFLGVLAYWLVMLETLVLAARSLDIAMVNSFATSIGDFLPSFLAFVLISITGFVVAAFLANITLSFARNAGVHGARLIAKAVKYSVIAVALVSAFRQLGVGASVLENVLSIAFAAVAFGAALAFGLGCKDLARSAMEKFLRNLRESERESSGKDLEG